MDGMRGCNWVARIRGPVEKKTVESTSGKIKTKTLRRTEYQALTPMCREASLTTTKRQKQPVCPSRGRIEKQNVVRPSSRILFSS